MSESCTDSFSHISCKRNKISASDSLVNLKIEQRLWIGSIISEELLQARANRVVLEYNSIVRRMACCAADVILTKNGFHK